MATTSILIFASLVLALHVVSAETTCSLEYCTRNGAKAKCDFTNKRGKVKTIKCKRWAKIDPTACPSVVCEVACPDLPKRGAVCDDSLCPDCRFPFEACKRRFKIFRPSEEECEDLTTPLPKRNCELRYCSRFGPDKLCNFKGKGIRCGDWPRLGKDVCPTVSCKECNLPAMTGPVCVKCVDCGFVFYSCKSNFELYRAQNCD